MLIAAVGIMVIPVFVSLSGRDSFRLPKLLLLRAEGLILLGLIGSVALTRARQTGHLVRTDRFIQLALAGIFWTLIVTLASPDRAISFESLLTVTAAVMIFLTAYLSARSCPPSIIWCLILPAAANGAALLLQRAGVWNPLAAGDPRFQGDGPYARTGLLGNPNDVADFLVIGIVCCLGLILSSTSARERLIGGTTLLLLLSALWTAAAIAGFAAVGAAGIVLLLRSLRTRRLAGVAVMIVLISSVMFVAYEIRSRAAAASQTATLDRVLSGRLIAFSTATAMGFDHPITGVGPGRYSAEFFDYQLASRYGSGTEFMRSALATNFGEAHNDFLQTFAESGVIGLTLLIGSIALIFRVTLAGDPSVGDQRTRIARIAGPASAVALFVLALAHFPLQLASTIAGFAFLGGLLSGWSEK